MNCSNCGKPLLAGSPICPVCGTDNTATLNQQNTPVVPNEQLNNNIQPQEPVSNLDNVESLEETNTLEQQGIQSPTNITEQDSSDITELDDYTPVEITETMAPPQLEVEKENLTQGAGDLSNEDSVSTYSDEAVLEQKNDEQAEKNRQETRVDIAIPKVGEVSDVSMPTDGSAPEISESKETAGETNTNTPATETPNSKRKKFNLNLAKGSKNVPKTLMIIVAIIFLVIGVLLGKIFFSKNYCSTSSTNRQIINKDKVKYVSDGKNNTTNVGGVTYKIPEQYTYDKSQNGLLIYGKDDSFRVYIKTEAGLYSDLTGAKNSIKASMLENSINIGNIKELKVSDVDFLVFETTTKLNNRMIVFSEANQDHIFYIEIVNANNNYDYDILDITADIIKNVTYEDSVSNMEKIDIIDIADVSLKAALEYKNLMNH